jgi:hypothetical protein
MRRARLHQRRQSAVQRRRWINATRPQLLRQLATAALNVKFDRRLLIASLEELAPDDAFIELVGEPENIRRSKYGQALAVALLLRHSWRPDDLEECANRLGLTMAHRRPAMKGRPRSRAAAGV